MIRSDHSWQKSYCEWTAQVTLQKWATMMDLLQFLSKNEWRWANPSFFWANSSFAHKKRLAQQNLNKTVFSCKFFVSFKNEWFAHSLFFKELCEQIAQVALNKRVTVSKTLRSLMKKSVRERFAQVAHDKRATVSNSLRALTKNEQIAGFFGVNGLFFLFLAKNEWFAHKTYEQIPNPDSCIYCNNWPSLPNWHPPTVVLTCQIGTEPI